MTSPTEHHRRSIRLKGYDYTQAGAYFITICTFQRLPLLGDVVNGEMLPNARGVTVRGCWDALPDHFPNIKTDAFVVMPNHIHGILWLTPVGADQGSIAPVGAQHAAPLRPSEHTRRITLPNVLPGSLGSVVRSFKSAATKRVNQSFNLLGSPLWQRNYYERIIRDDDELNNVRRYIADNPVNWAKDENNPANTSS